ncbi:MAG: FtsX-like permease family protein [Saprospiraceae bacterium]|nr:FtsX-like permease family protein [Saprospiraceae bacterium]
MIQNYLKVALKNFFRFRFVSAINLIGLTLGFAVCGMIYFFVQYEQSYDQFHSKIDRLYRLTTEFKYPGTEPRIHASTAPPMAPHIQQQFAEITSFTRLIPFEKNTIYKHQGKEIVIGQAFAADTSFFELFDFQLVAGDARTALKDPSNVVLTKSIADRLFTNENPLGKIITQTFSQGEAGDTTVSYVVTGILQDIPKHSHLQLDALFNINNSLPGDRGGQEWHGVYASSYLLAQTPIQNLTQFEDRIAESLKSVMSGAEYIRLYVQSVADVHLKATQVIEDHANYQKFDGRYIYIFSIIALIVLAIAGVNFTNLSTVIANKRAKEIGIRKTIGANRTSIVAQFLGESVLLTLVAALISALLIDLTFPALKAFIGREIEVNIFQNIPFLLTLLGTAILLGILAGLYPAFYMSSFQPIQALKKLQVGKLSKRLVINSLVVVQFITATALIIGTIVILQQLNFMKTQDKGFETSQIITADLGFGAFSKYETLKNEWLNVAGVENVTAARSILGGEAIQTGLSFNDKEGVRQDIAVPIMITDDDYLSFYEMKVINGSNFSENATQTGDEYIINETFAKQIGWENPIGQPMQLAWASVPGKIVGVVKDFNFNTLHHKITPLCIWASAGNTKEVSLKVSTGDLSATLSALESIWKKHITDRPFAYQFLDEHFAKLYESEQRIGRLMSAAAGLAVVIACLGLFGIAAFTTEQRTKEIGIRKVLGASVSNIVELLSRDFLILVLIAILIASPIAWYAMTQWLEDFAYRIQIQWWVFALAGVTAIGIALFTVSFQTIKAAISNPVKTLRTE